jgi:hypothetical protein
MAVGVTSIPVAVVVVGLTSTAVTGATVPVVDDVVVGVVVLVDVVVDDGVVVDVVVDVGVAVDVVDVVPDEVVPDEVVPDVLPTVEDVGPLPLVATTPPPAAMRSFER